MLLDLTVIADRNCPTSRAYLSYLGLAGYRLRGVLLVDFFYGDLRYATLRRRFGQRLGCWLARRYATAPRTPYDATFRRLSDQVQSVFPHRVNFFDDFDFAALTDHVTSLSVRDFDDPVLHQALERQPGRTFLYTNGGKVPEPLLTRPDLKILHVHPGVVPHVRGSNGLFWSVLVRGRPGASCFYMDPGIDTGALLATRDFDLPRFEGLSALLTTDQPLLEAVLLHSYDPHLRAQVLLDVIARHGADLGAAQASPQRAEDGFAYPWMDARLKRRALAMMVAD